MQIIRGDKIVPTLAFLNHQDSLVQHWANPGNLLPLAISHQLLQQQPFDENDLLLDDFVWLNEALIKNKLFQSVVVSVAYVEHNASRTKTYHSLELLPKMVTRLRQAYAFEGVRERVPQKLLLKRIHHLHLHLAHQLSRQGSHLPALKTWFQAVRLAKGRFIGASGKSFLKLFFS